MNYFNDDKEDVVKTIVTAIIVFIFAAIFESLLVFWLGYLGGIFAKIFVGNWLVEGFQLINITINKDNIPLLAGTLSWIGMFFHNVLNTNNNK